MHTKTKFEFLGNAAYRITNREGKIILIDPFLNESDCAPIKAKDLDHVDLVLVTHGAWDHLGDTLEIALKFQCPVVCGGEVRNHLVKHGGVDPAKVRAMCWGLQVVEAGIRVRSVTSMHWSFIECPDGSFISGPPMGFIFYPDPGVRVYHSGDTAIFSDMKLIGELYKPNIGLLCACNLEMEYMESLGLQDFSGNEMSGDEGAMAAMWLGVEYAIICHYLDPEGKEDVKKFFNFLERRQSDVVSPVKPISLCPDDVFEYQGFGN